jgi:maleamate amidohydrolase
MVEIGQRSFLISDTQSGFDREMGGIMSGEQKSNERIWDKFLTERDKQVFKAAGYDAVADWGRRPALLVVDVNYAFCGEAPLPILESIKKWRNSCGEDAWEAMPVLQRLIAASRAKGLPVIYTTGTGRPDKWNRGAWLWKNRRVDEVPVLENNTRAGLDGDVIVDEIAPAPQDIVVRKLKASGFSGTPLASYLQLLQADSVIVTGTTTSGCVRATVLDAFALNFRITVVEDGCFDRSQASHAINLCDMHAKYANVMPSSEVLSYIDSLPGGLFDLPTGEGYREGEVWY